MMTVVDDDVAIYRRHADELIRYATALVGPHDAADVVTDGVLAAFASSGWSTVMNPRAYLYRAVYSRAVSMRRSDLRRARREAAVSLPDRVEPSPSSTDAHRALVKLSPQQRAVVYFTYWDDLLPSQIAELLDVSEGTVRKQLARARDHLRRILDAH
jgi:RNA polymerase sigma factor (sigma-70 family)